MSGTTAPCVLTLHKRKKLLYVKQEIVCIENPWIIKNSSSKERKIDKTNWLGFSTGEHSYKMIYEMDPDKIKYYHRNEHSTSLERLPNNTNEVLYFDQNAKHGLAGQNFYAYAKDPKNTYFVITDLKDGGVNITYRGKQLEAKKGWVFSANQVNNKVPESNVTFEGNQGQIMVHVMHKSKIQQLYQQGTAQKQGDLYYLNMALPETKVESYKDLVSKKLRSLERRGVIAIDPPLSTGILVFK